MQGSILLAWLYWNPPVEAFTIPWINHPVVWYGILFVTGYIIGYFIFVPIMTRYLRNSKHIASIDIGSWKTLLITLQKASPDSPQLLQQLLKKLDADATLKLKDYNPDCKPDAQLKDAIVNGLNRLLHDRHIQREDLEQAFPGLNSAKRTAYFLADRLVWFTVLGTLIGARLGQVFFYDWTLFYNHPSEIFKVWKGGLASHGGVIGVATGIYLYLLSIRKWVPHLSFLRLLDMMAIPSALAACFIRLGNFMNQEIMGTPSTLPWAIIFGNAPDGSLPIPRHPVQLYEALAYLLTFVILYRLWKTKGEQLRSGVIVGLLFILIFSSRFILEFWKMQQVSIIDSSFLQMGQILSIPFILIGFLLVSRQKKFSCCSHQTS